MSQVIVRFAPSPTGMLHIGGARTALFNYLFAKKNNGKFLLRIEDTDLARSTESAKVAIINGMKWLGLQWDEDVVYQMTRQEKHKQAAEIMVKKGLAYYAYDNVEEITAEKLTAQKNNKIYRYNPKWRNCNLTIPDNIKPTIRLKIPSGKTIWQDMIKGKIEFSNNEIEDFVLLRSDGVPTYMLAVVVDDIDMKITHVIRGDDHVSNTPKQILLYEAMKAQIPFFGHIPLIYDINGQKLSKRKSAAAVEDYEKMGYLPEAICSYLMQLGWSSKIAGDKLMSIEEAMKVFEVSELGSSPSRFDFDKLDFINLQYLQSKSTDQIIEIISQKINLDGQEKERITKVCGEIKKTSTINELIKLALPFTKQLLVRDENAIKIIFDNPEVVEKLKIFILNLNIENFKIQFEDFLKANNWKFSYVGPILRSILIGKVSSLNLSTIIEGLGKEECLKRFSI